MKYKLLALFEIMRQLYTIYAKGYIVFLLGFVWIKILKRIGVHNKNLIYYQLDDIWLYVPRHEDAYQTIREVFVENLYKSLISCSHILDLWAYVGDSALYFAHHEAKVTAYEMNPDLYAIAVINTYADTRITLHHGAVLANHAHHAYMDRRSMYDNGGRTTNNPQQSIHIPCYHIIDILKEHHFDGLKMDIEWWEYPIMEAIMANDLFPFERGIIELHNIQNADHSMLIDRFVDYLRKHNYTIRFFHNEDSKYAKEHPSMQWIKNLFFAKKI